MKENRSAFTEAKRSRDAAVKWPLTLRVIFGVSMSMQPMLLTQGCKLADKAFKRIPCIQAVCADAGYRGTFVNYVNETWGRAVHISEKIKDGFAVLPKRWVVERTFAWLNCNRRLSKDYKKTTSSSESQVLIASISRNLKLF